MSDPDRSLVVLVACGSQKRDLPDGETCPAKDLYTGGYFCCLWSYAERFGTRQFILSAKHGLLEPDEEIEPYDASLSSRYDSYIGQGAVERWGTRVGTGIRMFRWKHYCDEVVVLAGRDYIEPLAEPFETLVDGGVPVHDPFFDLGGIGKQKQWCNDAVAAGDPQLPDIDLTDEDDEGETALQTETVEVETGADQAGLDAFMTDGGTDPSTTDTDRTGGGER